MAYRRIGISAMGFYFPRQYISLEELLLSRGEEPKKAIEGLGVQRMAILANNEDSVTMAANAISALDFSREKIGKLVFATECGLDSAKDNSTYLFPLLNLPENCEAYDVKAACAASTYALWQVIDWILSGRNKGKQGLVVCSDKAVYEHKSGAEITGGGGAVALVMSEDPSIISFDFEMGDYKSNIRDFWKPLSSECAVIAEDGKPSVKSYLDALSPSYKDYIDNGGKKNFDFLVFHTPYAKMVHKAFNVLSKILPEINGNFESMTADSLRAPALVGNIYNGALYLALASLLELKGASANGKSIGFYSFGSGSSSKFFRGVVDPKSDNQFGLFKQLESMEKISPEKYEKLRQGEIIIEETEGLLLNGIDEQGYRHYSYNKK
ncbi:MAG: hydroxymethylglutaryl-CoA synthase family protein [Promethearchaeota archaeon]